MTLLKADEIVSLTDDDVDGDSHDEGVACAAGLDDEA
eukprot:CAMPEP_0174886284 /NCGR_PEP_ID=MMETSP0167-20121228/1551_1 /TAXON_ID=38298 /ORGANISM="Rhodella maculata, Strain CCMP736" /LENGTH=36 /DNA_ID= /DNA_START= /DNA_END= /DNA_ORIENTATION=